MAIVTFEASGLGDRSYLISDGVGGGFWGRKCGATKRQTGAATIFNGIWYW